MTENLRKISLRDSVYFIEACSLLLVSMFLKTFVPFRWYAPLLGKQGTTTKLTPVAVDLDRLVPVIRAVNRAIKYFPFKGKCLVQALSAFLMLRARSMPSDFYLGVNKNETRDVIAHAWLKSGKYFVVGQAGHRNYAVISVFSSRPASREEPSS
jgi:hypothetical protein